MAAPHSIARAPKAFSDEEKARIGWVAPVARPSAEDRVCHRCQHYCFRDAEKTRVGNGGAFGHLVPCCRVLETVGGSVRTTGFYAACDNWGCRR